MSVPERGQWSSPGAGDHGQLGVQGARHVCSDTPDEASPSSPVRSPGASCVVLHCTAAFWCPSLGIPSQREFLSSGRHPFYTTFVFSSYAYLD